MRLRIIALIIMLAGLLPGQMVYADDISDATITTQSFNIYRNLASSGDSLFVFHWRWTADNVSDTPASSAVILTLSYNGTIISSASPYVYLPFDNNGWGDAVSAFYLSDNNTHWDSTLYDLRILGTEYIFGADPPVMDYEIQPSDYTAATTQADNREELRLYVMTLCDEFSTFYPDVNLKSVASGKTVLSAYGETYFMSTIPGLMTLCPELFLVQAYVPGAMDIQTYDTSLADTATNRLVGTDLQRGATRLGTHLGMSGAVVWGIFYLIGMIAIFIACGKRGWGMEVGIVISSFVLVGLAVLIGSWAFTMSMIVGFVAVIGIGWAFFGKRA